METPVRTFRGGLTLLLALILASCGKGEEQEDSGPVSAEAYVQVMTELMLLDANPPEGATEEERAARADSARSSILAGRQVTAAEVLDFVESLGGEAGQMEDLWRQITHRYDSARIAELDVETEARSEPEGKLGAEARAAATGSSAGPGADSVAATVDSLERATPLDSDLRRRLRRPVKGRPAAPDTTAQQD